MSGYNAGQIKAEDHSCRCWNHNIHTQPWYGEVHTAVTLIPATTKVEKKSKDVSGAANRRTRSDILVRWRCGW